MSLLNGYSALIPMDRYNELLEMEKTHKKAQGEAAPVAAQVLANIIKDFQGARIPTIESTSFMQAVLKRLAEDARLLDPGVKV